MKIYALIISLVFVIPVSASADCTKQEAMTAETTASTIKTWRDLEAHFNKYGQCDDGAISEGYSESVSFLMESNWPEFLKYKMKKPFFAFVKKHVDETWEINRYKNVVKLAKENCNQSKMVICNAIIKDSK